MPASSLITEGLMSEDTPSDRKGDILEDSVQEDRVTNWLEKKRQCTIVLINCRVQLCRCMTEWLYVPKIRVKKVRQFRHVRHVKQLESILREKQE